MARAAAPIRRNVSHTSGFDSRPLAWLPIVAAVPATFPISGSSGTATTPLITTMQKGAWTGSIATKSMANPTIVATVM
jgi:hypothetical protein